MSSSTETVSPSEGNAQSQSYDVYPLHLLDDPKNNSKFVTWTMRFNDVLDAGKLSSSLARLLELGDWRKLGGRLQRNSQKEMELHVPLVFTKEMPAVTFTHDQFLTVNIEDHPLASQMPKLAAEPYAQTISTPLNFLSLAARSNFPKTIEEMVQRNIPWLSLHVTSFKNATLVALAWPHIMMDAMGQTALLQAWSLVLAGKEDQVAKVVGAREDVLNALDVPSHKESSKDRLVIEDKRLSGFNSLRFVLNFLWQKFRNPPKATRMVFLPQNAFAQLQKEAKEQGNGEFVSEGDLLVGWVTRINALARPSSRPVTMVHLLNARGRVDCAKDSSVVYLQNMVAIAFTFLSAEVAGDSVARIARENRHQLQEQASEEQLSTFFRLLRRDLKAKKKAKLLFGETNSSLIFFNNLTKAKFIKAANFGPAVLSKGEATETRVNPIGAMSYYLHQGIHGYEKGCDNFYVLDKDYGGNYWLMGTLSDRAWTKFDEELERLKAASVS